MDRDKNLMKRTRDVEAATTTATAVKQKKKSLLNEATIIPNPQPQISTPVPSTTNTERNQRISLMSDSQIMERLRKIFITKDKWMTYNAY
jgi:hypothetical protein